MTDHAEEQEMEAEALTAIFDTHFSIINSTPPPPAKWSIQLYPEMADQDELDDLNHVACTLSATLPEDYPESLPTLGVELIKGLAPEHLDLLTSMAAEEAEANLGVPSIFAIAERLREWLLENNRKGLDDMSMHAQMMRKKQEEQTKQQNNTTEYESQKQEETMTQTELEEMAVRKRREEGTPCNLENFLAWKERFESEMAEQLANATNETTKSAASRKKDKKAVEDKEGRITGFAYFSGKTGNLEALEAAAEQAEKDETPIEEEYDEDLFEDDVDLDDLDFDDDEELDI